MLCSITTRKELKFGVFEISKFVFLTLLTGSETYNMGLFHVAHIIIYFMHAFYFKFWKANMGMLYISMKERVLIAEEIRKLLKKHPDQSLFKIHA